MKYFGALIVHIAFLIAAAAALALDTEPRYAVAIIPTPVLNSADFAGVFGGPEGKTLRIDACGQVRETEFVALPGTAFRVEEILSRNDRVIYRVSTDDYPFPTAKGYFIDSRFVKLVDNTPPPRTRRLPSRREVVDNLLAAMGSRYVWGGNRRAGIPQMLSFYPPAADHALTPAIADLWQFRGVDCSGLLYEATDGFTPRNTSALVSYGSPVPIRGRDAGEIAQLVEPLDLIAWPGHVMIVLDRERIIESVMDCHSGAGGVRVRPLRKALVELIKSRVPLNDVSTRICVGLKGFVIRRWYGHAASTLR